MNEPVLRVKNLTTKITIESCAYKVVDDLSFDLFAGKTLSLVGESGCGKSMTALSLLRILPAPPCLSPEGEVWYRDENLLAASEKRMRAIRGAQIAMIFQDPSTALNPVYTVGEQLLEVLQLHMGIYGDEALERMVRALANVGISSPEGRLYDYPHQMSGGMRQRVMIAMALLCEPDILIADEPTTALDVTIQAQVLDLIRQLQEEKGMALLLITHDMGVVAEMADDVIVMYASQAVEKSDAAAMFDRRCHPYTSGLFHSRPGSHFQAGEKLYTIKGTVPQLTQYPSGCRFHPRCPYAMEKCVQGDVPVFFPNGQGHQAKCWIWDDSEISKFQLLQFKQDEECYSKSRG